MGQIWRKQIEGREFTLVARSWSNSRAWGHECQLYLNGSEEESYRIRYYNRTWECYCYQSVIKSCLDKYIGKLEAWWEARFREEFNVKRMTKHLRETLGEWMKDKAEYTTIVGLKAWYDEL